MTTATDTAVHAPKCLVEKAVSSASLGWRIHPLHPGEKKPRLKNWPEKATTDQTTILGWWMKWPESNVGIATGDGLIILDVDGPDGRESLKEFSSLPPTITATTPRADGGMQVYFSADEELEEVAKNRVQLLPGLDIRAAGGYVVAPPSSLDPYDKNPEGGEYTWVDYSSPEDVDLAPAPDWLRELLVTGHRAHGQKQVAPRKTATETTRYGEVALQRECAELARTSEPGRNNQLNEAAFSIGRLVAGGEIVEAEARQALTAAADDCRLIADDGERQVQATLNSGLSSGMKEPRAAPEAQERLRRNRFAY